jgi:hypothetical protein
MRRRLRIGLGIALVLGGLVAHASAAATRLSDADRTALPTLVELRRVDAVPAGVWTAFATVTTDHGSPMANPGEKWQATDVILEKDLPWRRLIFAGVSDDYCLLHYERGGIAHSFHLMLFRRDGGEWRMVWSAASGQMAQLSDVPAALQSAAVSDDPKYQH